MKPSRRDVESKNMVVFVAHCSPDKRSTVEPLIRHFKSADIDAWYDKERLRLGCSLPSNLEAGILRADQFLLVITPTIGSREHANHFTVFDEWKHAYWLVRGNKRPKSWLALAGIGVDQAWLLDRISRIQSSGYCYLYISALEHLRWTLPTEPSPGSISDLCAELLKSLPGTTDRPGEHGDAEVDARASESGVRNKADLDETIVALMLEWSSPSAGAAELIHALQEGGCYAEALEWTIYLMMAEGELGVTEVLSPEGYMMLATRPDAVGDFLTLTEYLHQARRRA